MSPSSYLELVLLLTFSSFWIWERIVCKFSLYHVFGTSTQERGNQIVCIPNFQYTWLEREILPNPPNPTNRQSDTTSLLLRIIHQLELIYGERYVGSSLKMLELIEVLEPIADKNKDPSLVYQTVKSQDTLMVLFNSAFCNTLTFSARPYRPISIMIQRLGAISSRLNAQGEVRQNFKTIENFLPPPSQRLRILRRLGARSMPAVHNLSTERKQQDTNQVKRNLRKTQEMNTPKVKLYSLRNTRTM